MNISPIVTISLAVGFASSALIAYSRGEVIRKQTETLAALDDVLIQYERGAASLVKNYESASLRASMALAAYDRCRGLRGVSAP